MSTRKAWILYIVIRLGLFAAVLAVLLLIGINPWVSAVAAALIAFAISLLVLQRPRSEISAGISRWRQGSTVDPVVDQDTVAEDALIDATSSTSSAPARTEQQPEAPEASGSEGEGRAEPR